MARNYKRRLILMSYDWENRKPQRYNAQRLISISLIVGVITILTVLTSCGGGGGSSYPGTTPSAWLTGTVTFSQAVPLAPPPPDMFDGPAPPELRYAARIIDPGDDIGSVPLPNPSNLSISGNYQFDGNEPDPLAFFNLRFIVEADLHGDGSTQTPISLNIPIALANGIGTLLEIIIHRPRDSILEMIYEYEGPDGSRVARLQLDFMTDLLYFDLDSDGLFDDLVAIDYNHDAIPDAHAPYMEILDYTETTVVFGTITGIGSNTLSVGGNLYEIWGHTNLESKIDGSILTLSDISNGKNATVNYTSFAGNNIASSVVVEPGPTNPGLEFTVTRSGHIEEIDSTSLVVSGGKFEDYPSANIINTNGSPVAPSVLEVGKYVSVTGERDENTITATEIIVTEVTAPPSIIERQGTIQALDPVDNPTSLTVTGITFQITPQTVIKDNAGTMVDTTYLLTGSPVYVLGREIDGTFTADLIELQYEIEHDTHDPEIVVLINDEEALQAVQNAIDLLNPAISIAPVLVSSYPPALSAPPCTYDVFNAVFLAKPILVGIPGFIEAFPRYEDDQCHVLMLLDNGYPAAQAWVYYFYPNGLGEIGGYDGYPIIYDKLVLPPYYGASSELINAIFIADLLEDLLSTTDYVIDIYISPDVGFSE